MIRRAAMWLGVHTAVFLLDMTTTWPRRISCSLVGHKSIMLQPGKYIEGYICCRCGAVLVLYKLNNAIRWRV